MEEEVINDRKECQNETVMPQYTPFQELFHNIPYILMCILGAAIMLVASFGSAWGIIAGIAFVIYGLLGALWIMIFVCPYCVYWNTKSCPCGYGRIASRFREKAPIESFGEKFKKHIPVIVPLWLIPVFVGVPIVVRSFSWILLSLIIIFIIEAFVILPLVSTRHGCKDCPQRDTCPWMKNKKKTAA